MDIALENMINKDISFMTDYIGYEFNLSVFNTGNEEIRLYSASAKESDLFYGMMFQQITIHTDGDDIVKSAAIHFQSIFDRKFYDAFVKSYGEPKNILVANEEKLVSEVRTSPNEQIRRYEIELREGSFEEKPLYIIWEKEHYTIKALLRHSQGISEITFNSRE